PNRATGFALLRETKLLAQVLQEVAELNDTDFGEARRILAALNAPSISLALAALLLQAPRSPLPADVVARRLLYTNREIDRTTWLLDNRPLIASAPRLHWPKLQRLLTHEGTTELVALHEAITGPHDPALAFCRERLAWPPERLNPRPLLDGGALI